MTVVFCIIAVYVLCMLIKEKRDNKRSANIPSGYEIDWGRMSNDLMNGKSKRQTEKDCVNGYYLKKK